MRTYLTLFLLCISLSLLGQKSTDSIKMKTNPVLYASIMMGWSENSKVKGLTFSTDINYQFNKNLITFKALHISEIKEKAHIVEAILIIPLFFGGDSMNEYGLLYGKRFIFNNSALNVSIGISSNLIKYTNEADIKTRKTYTGVPFEINWHLFKGQKKRFRILYGLVPIGKPTSFGRNFGIKFYGNIGKFNYFGIGLTSGLGWHKKY